MSTTTWGGVLALPISPSRDHVLGAIGAPVTLIEYGDYECPFCAVAHGVVGELRRRLGEELCFAFRHFPLTTVHPRAQIAAEAAEAAGAQRMFWDMHDTLYRNEQRLDDSHLMAYARALRLNLQRFHGDLVSHAHLPKVREDFMSGIRSGVNGTPTFYINGARYNGSWELPQLLAAAQQAAGGHER